MKWKRKIRRYTNSYNNGFRSAEDLLTEKHRNQIKNAIQLVVTGKKDNVDEIAKNNVFWIIATNY